MAQMQQTDIFIAGGGPAGLVAALLLQRAGREVVLAEPFRPAASMNADGSDLRSTAILAPGIALLHEAGLWERLGPEAVAIETMRILDAGGRENRVREQADFHSEEAGQPAFGYNFANWRLTAALWDAIDASSVRVVASPVQAAVFRSEEARVTLSDGTRIAARLAIGADGRDSALRRLAGIGVRRVEYGQSAIVFVVEHDGEPGPVSTEIHRSGGPFTLVPLPRGDRARSAVVWMERQAEAERLMTLAAEDFEAEATERSCGILGPLSLVSPRRIWPIISQLADRMTAARLALVAEAAHVVPPIGAQGLNTSLKDIRVLRDIIETASDPGLPVLLDRYGRARHADIATRMAGIDLLNRAAMAEPQPIRDLRRAGLGLLHRSPLRRLAMRAGLGK